LRNKPKPPNGGLRQGDNLLTDEASQNKLSRRTNKMATIKHVLVIIDRIDEPVKWTVVYDDNSEEVFGALWADELPSKINAKLFEMHARLLEEGEDGYKTYIYEY
jgi:hypothetical protein